jgi:hypothetical protein
MPDGLQNPLRTRNILTARPLYGLSDSKRKRFKCRFGPNKGLALPSLINDVSLVMIILASENIDM